MPTPVVIEPHYAIGEIVYHKTGEARGMVIGYRVTGGDAFTYEIRWAGEEMSDAYHEQFELSPTPNFE